MPRRQRYRGAVGSAVVLILLIGPMGRLFAGPRSEIPRRESRPGTSPRQRVSPPRTPKERIRTLRKGDSSRSARKRALAELPLDKLTAAKRQQARRVLRSASWFRRLPTLAFPVDGEAYQYFIDHPHVAVAIWHVMGISKFRMQPIGPDRYHADAGDGTVGTIEVLLQNRDATLIVCDGVYTNVLLFRPIKARALLYLTRSFFRDADGKPSVKHRASLFVSFPSYPVRTVAKILAPLSNLVIDRNFQEVSLFLHMMSLAMQQRPGWIEHLVNKRNGVLRKNREQLLEVTARVYVAYRKQQLAGRAKSSEFKGVVKPRPITAAGTANGKPAAASPPRVAVSPNRDRGARTE